MRAIKFNIEYTVNIIKKLAQTLEPDTAINEQALTEIEEALGDNADRIVLSHFSGINNCTFTINVEKGQASLSQTAIYERQLKTIDPNLSLDYLIQTVIDTHLLAARKEKEKRLEKRVNQADRWVGSLDTMQNPLIYTLDTKLAEIDEGDEYEQANQL